MLTALPHARHHRFSYIKGNHPPNIPRFFLSSPESPTTFASFVPRHSIALFLPPPPLFGATPICGSRLQIRLRFLGLRLLPQATIRLRCCAIGHGPIRATGASISPKYDAPYSTSTMFVLYPYITTPYPFQIRSLSALPEPISKDLENEEYSVIIRLIECF